MKLKVIFGVKKTYMKKSQWYGVEEHTCYEIKTFVHECDAKKSYWENMCDAHDKAIALGHEPDRNIKIRVM